MINNSLGIEREKESSLQGGRTPGFLTMMVNVRGQWNLSSKILMGKYLDSFTQDDIQVQRDFETKKNSTCRNFLGKKLSIHANKVSHLMCESEYRIQECFKPW